VVVALARTRAVFVGLVVLAGARAAAGATLFDPALRFRTIATEHFVIYFHQGADRLAARLAVIAEQTWNEVRLPFGQTAPRRTHVVLADQSEAANGWATPLPYNTIVLNAAWPSGSAFTSHTEEWLRIVFVHEFTHIVHLDRSRGWARVVRRLFGRTGLAFPNLFLPEWQIEGLATYEESALTGGGRLRAMNFRAIEKEAARTGTLEPLDRVNGGLTDWAGDVAPYAYGLGFHDYLADRYGAERLTALAEATAGRVPYFISGAFENTFGRSLQALWKDYQSALARDARPAAPEGARIRRLTHHGFGVTGPRFAPPLCAGCPPEIVYAARSPHGFPSLNAVALDGSSPRRLATRYLGSTSGVVAGFVVFDQQERRRNAGLYSDLFVLDRARGTVWALTNEARLLDPDVSADGRTIVAVREGLGRRELVVVRRPEGAEVLLKADTASKADTTYDVLVSEDDTQFNAPRWSPDGRSIAVERHRRGKHADIVIVDAAAKTVRIVAALESARVATPAWRADGRAVVAAAEVGGEAFNLYEFPLDGGSPRRLTSLSGGATWPDVSPDGTTIVFVGYTVDGFDLFVIPYPASTERADTAAIDAFREPPRGDGPNGPEQDDRVDAPEVARAARYSPWPTLRPTSWSPVVDTPSDQLRIGVSTGGYDVLGYHLYALAATWLVNGPGTVSRLPAWRPDWTAAYAYDRWRPTMFVSASRDTSFLLVSGDGRDAQRAPVATREVEAGVLFPFRRVRTSHRLQASVVRSDDEYRFADEVRSIGGLSARLGAAITTARRYGYSISPEDGIRAGVTMERAQTDLASDRHVATATADVRAYLPGWQRHHVVAIRAGGGLSLGNTALDRSFTLGGSASAGDVIAFERDLFSLLRGFAANTFAGRRIFIVNADYRWPIARPQRGVGTWPVFLHTVHGAAFTDVGHAWSQAFRSRDLKTSIGAELSTDLVVGYALPLTVTVGVGWGRDGARRAPDGAMTYVRIGGSF
jgi:hypothetical protein